MPEEEIAKLVILKDAALVAETPLVAKRMTIGRDAESDIRLNDLSVSRSHARLVRVFKDFYVEDLQSTNGTFLNDRQVSKHMLKLGDLLRIGGFTLRLTKQGESAQTAVEAVLDRTVVMATGGKQSNDSTGAGQPRAVAEAPKTATLRFFRGPHKGQSERIERSLYTVGRPGGALAVIARRPQGFFLLHIGGDRYPKVNDQDINTTKAVQLKEGDMVEVGDNLAEISFRG